MKPCLLAFLLLLLFQEGAWSCESSDAAVKVVSKETVTLQTAPQEIYFYYRLGRYAVFVDRHTFTQAVEKGVKAHSYPADKRLLKAIQRLPANAARADAFALAIEDPTLLGQTERYLGELLEAGQAAVVDVYEFPGDVGRVVRSLTIVKLRADNWAGRRFCTPSGQVVLELTDMIV